MATIFKTKDNLYCVNTSFLIKKYNLVILIDNFHMHQSICNETLKNLPFYINQKTTLIVTFPDIKTYEVDETNIFTIFHKIKCQPNRNKLVDKNVYVNSINKVKEHIINIPDSCVFVFNALESIGDLAANALSRSGKIHEERDEIDAECTRRQLEIYRLTAELAEANERAKYSAERLIILGHELAELKEEKK